MKKEVLFAIGLGFVLGLVITFGIWVSNQSLKKLQTTSNTTPTVLPTISISGTPMPAPTLEITNPDLVILTPADEALFNKNTTELSGKTYPNTVVTIFSEDDEQMVTSDDKGNFKTTVDLVGGFNIIKVTAFNPDGIESSQSITVTYTTSKI